MGAQQHEEHAMATELAIETLVQRIAEQFRPLRIVLFGSRARGEATASDIDLLVVLPAVEDRRQAAIAIRRALGDCPWPRTSW
jgi:predicted nucleotidyltransferase